MGTRSKTTIFNEQGKPLVSIYRQYDGHYESHGAELAEILSEIAVVNGFGSHTPAKAANGMGCLAAQIVDKLKDGIGNIYIVPTDSEDEEYNYEIRFVKIGDEFGVRNRVSLVGKNYGSRKKTFKLYAAEPQPEILRRVEFVYDKRDGNGANWRKLDVTSEDGTYLEGIEVETGKFKRFLVSRVVGQRVIPAK
jgi:hypothetical protein